MSAEQGNGQAADVIVVGLGAMGAATLYHLAKAGVRVLGIDRFHPPHELGSSHGETRATRLAVGEGDAYVPLVHQSHDLWRELEKRTGERLLEQCGLLMIDTSSGNSPLHGLERFFDRTVGVARRWNIEHETFAGEELRRRHPVFLAPDDANIYFEPAAGFVYPERCIATQLAEARRAGALIHTGEKVLKIVQDGAAVSVTTDQARYGAARAVIAAGAWTPALVGEALSEVRLFRQVLHWFQPPEPSGFMSPEMPVFLWLHGPRPEDIFYGFPIPPGGSCVKVATEQYVVATSSADNIDRSVHIDESKGFFDSHIENRLSGLGRLPARSAACVYANAPAARFIIDHMPSCESIVFVSACSGHGFKHSPALGEYVADLVCGRATLREPFTLASHDVGRPAA